MSSNGNSSLIETSAIIERFRSSLGPFAASVDASNAPIVFTDAGDKSAPIVFCSDSFCALVGRGREAILTRPLEGFFVSAPGSAAADSILSALRSGQGVTGILRCQSDDGTSFQTAVFVTPVHDGLEQHTYNCILFVKLVELYDDLIQKRDELNAIYEHAPGFIATSEGPDHVFTFANAAYKRFVGCHNLVGKTVVDALPCLVEQGINKVLDVVFQSGVPYVGTDVEMTFTDYKGDPMEPRYCDFVYQPVRAQDSSITGLFCAGYDVTERHKSAIRLAELQREIIHLSRVNAMGTMAATLAHELNQPLAAIASYAEAGRRIITEQNEAGVGQALEALNAIADVTHRTGNLIKNLRDLTATRQSHWDSFDLREMIEECVRLISAASERYPEIVDLLPDGIQTTGDRTQIQQVVINLLSNACESGVGDQQLKIEIKGVARPGFICICIRDNGAGVSLKAAETLFILTESTKSGGMGIGLSVSRTIIEGHGGKIWLENTDATGSEFCFTLPCAETTV